MKFKALLKKSFPATLVALAGILIVSSGWQHYQGHPLKPVASEVLPTFSLQHSQVSVLAKAMTPDESTQNFGHNLQRRGIQPLQLTIQNNTSNEYSLCESSVDLVSVKASKVATKVMTSSIPRGIGLRIASFIFWPMMIPSTIDSIYVLSAHRSLKKDLLAKSLKQEVVAPYSTYNRVLFVPEKEFKDTFKVTLIDIESLQATEFQTTVVGAEKTPTA